MKIDLGFTNIVFNPTLSWIILPLFAFLYYNYLGLRPIIFNTLIAISIIGSVKTIEEYHNKELIRTNQLTPKWQYYSGLLLHLSLLLILKDFYKYGYFNKYSLILMIIEIFILYFLPWWPYPTSNNKEFILYLITINLILYSAHRILGQKK